MSKTWQDVACDLCSNSGRKVAMRIPHPAAPEGMASIVQCTACDLLYVSPRPPVHDLGSYYPTEYNAYVGRTRGPLKQFIWNLCRDAGVDVFDISFRGKPGTRLLDIGCGYGDLLMYYQSRGLKCVGVDFDSRGVSAGQAMGLDIHLGSVEDLSFPSNSFDAIIMCHSLEHMPNPSRTIAEVFRLLAPGGLLEIAVPNGASPRFGPAWAHLSFPLHLYHFTASTLTKYLRSFRVTTTAVRRDGDILRAIARKPSGENAGVQ